MATSDGRGTPTDQQEQAAPDDPMEDDTGSSVVQLLVSDLSPDLGRELVESYFESRMVKVVDVSPPSEGKCIVSVTELEDIEKFCGKKHKINKHPIQVEQYCEVANPDTIEVVYPPDVLTQSALECYFSGPLSGERDDKEDKIIEWIRIIKPGRCHIKFESLEDAACVLAKKSHNFMKKELVVGPVLFSTSTVNIEPSTPPIKFELLDEDTTTTGVTPPTLPLPDTPDAKTLPTKPKLQPGINSKPTYVTPPTKTELPAHVLPSPATPTDMPPLVDDNDPTVSDGSQSTNTGTTNPDVVPVKTSTLMKGEDKYEQNKLIIRNIPENAAKVDYLESFLENTIGFDSEDNYSIELDEDHVMLTFNKEYTVEELKYFCEKITSQKMKGQYPLAELCEVIKPDITDGGIHEKNCETDKLIIRNIPEKAAKIDYLESYLESALELESEDNYSIELEKDQVLLTFNKEYTVEELKLFCDKIMSQKMKGQYPSAELYKVHVGGSHSKDEDRYERKKLIIRNIPEKAAKIDYLESHLENVLELESEDNYSIELEEDHVMLTFNKQYTIEELKSFCEKISSQTIKGQTPLAELCKVVTPDITEGGSHSMDEDKYKGNKLIIRNIPEKAANVGYLESHLERLLEFESEDNYIIELDEGQVMLTFNKQYTVEELKLFCDKISSQKMKGRCPTAELCKLVISDGGSHSKDEDKYERNKLIITNIPEKAANVGYLESHLERVLEFESEDNYHIELDKDHVILTFNKQYIVEELKLFCEKISSQTMKGQTPLAELCKVVTPDITDGGSHSKDEDQYERNKLIIRNIPEGVDDAYFEVFLDGQLDLETDNCYSFELLKTGAILTFAKEYSIEELNNFCELIMSGNLKDQVVVAELCKTNCTVLITEITKESFASQDGLKMYFGSKKSGGGKNLVEEVVMLGKNRAKVTFKSSQTVTSVLSKDHSTLGPNVKMVVCSPLVDMEEESSEELCDDPPLSSPTEKRKKSSSADENETDAKKMKRDRPFTKLNLDLLVAKYLGNNADLLDGIGREVNATVTLVDWNTGIIELVMNDIDTSPDNLQSAVTQFNSLMSSTVRRADIHFPPEANADASKTIVNFSSANNLPVDFTRDDCIGIAGKIHQIDDLEKMVHDLCDRIVLASEQIPLSSEDIMYFSSRNTIKATTKAHSNVKIGLNASTNVLSVSGSRRDVAHFKESLSGLIQHATVPVQVSKLGIEFLKDGKGASILNTLIKSDRVFPFFSEDPYGNVTLSLLCPHDHAQHAETTSAKISATILEKELKFPQYFYTDVADSPQFNNFKQKMSDKYAFLCSVEQNGQVFKLVCRDEIQKQLSDLFHKFVTEECSITERIQMKRGVWRLLNSAMEKKWSKLEAEMMDNGLKVLSKSKPKASKPFLKIKGERNVMAQMKEKLMELKKSVHELEFTVARPGIVQHFYKDPHGQVSLTGIESRAKVCIELEVQNEDVESDTSTPTGKGSGSFKKVCTANTHGVTINLYTGDITQFNKAEVIVNAANEGLNHGSGIAGAIVDRGGPIISKDSQDYVYKRGKVPTGSAVLFPRVGNLPPPYQAIVHAVGPTWYGGSSKDKNIALLRKTIKNTLKKAKAFNSIAIPAISSGVFGFPVDVCANSLVQAVLEFIGGNSDCNLNEINFVIFDDKIPAFKQAMKEQLRNVHSFDEAQPSVPRTTPTPTTSRTSPQMSLRSRSKRSSSKLDTSISVLSSISTSTGKKSKDAILKCIKITKDDILKHQCEVLVNTTDQQLGFGGYVGRVLLKAAGSGLQDECQAITKPIQYGDIVTTKAYNLQSKHIVHVVLPGYGGGTQSETALRGVVNKCLKECTRLNAKSISIPSVGAGNLGYPSDVVASCLLEEAFQYLTDNNGRTSLQLIHFIIFDSTVHQAFQQHYSRMSVISTSTIDTTSDPVTTEIKTLRTKPRPSGSTPTSSSSSAGKKRSSKKPSNTSSRSSVPPPNFTNRCSFALPNDICLHVIEGDITDQRTDVIVNTTNPELLLAGGGVSGALLKKGGEALQDACNKTKASNMRAAEGKVVETRCEGIGQLKCKSIFHIVFEGKEQRKLVKTIQACLDRAEKMKYTSIAIPAIGTGVVAYPSSLAAEGIVKALKQFTKNGPKHVKEIRMVIFQPSMFREFTDAFRKIEQESGSDGILNYIYDKSAQFWDKSGRIIDSAINTLFSGDDPMEWTNVTHDDDISDDLMECSDNEDDEEDNQESEDDFEHITTPLDEDVLSNISVDTEVTMYIYGESDQAVKRAEKMLRGIVDTLIVNEEIDDENIPELSSTVINDLKELAKQNNVEIDIDNDSDLHSIKLHGCQNDVLKVKEKVRDALNHVHQFKAKKEVASTVSKHFKWVRQLSDGPEDYNEVYSLEIERAFQQEKPSYQHDVEGDRFTIDFSKMEETDLEDGEKVKVTRVDFAKAYDKPSEWVSMPKDSNNREVTVHLVTLKQTDKEYQDVISKFDPTMKSSLYSYQIVSIQRIQNPVLYGQYIARKKEMEKRNPPGCQNERWLFHGTNSGVIDAINTQGFNRSFKSTTMYGQGVYFARDASYSHGYAHPDPSNNHRCMYLARVLTGEFTVGVRSMLVPPAKNNAQNKHILYDSTVDGTSNPSIFVVYTDSQAYAAYLITYK